MREACSREKRRLRKNGGPRSRGGLFGGSVVTIHFPRSRSLSPRRSSASLFPPSSPRKEEPLENRRISRRSGHDRLIRGRGGGGSTRSAVSVRKESSARDVFLPPSPRWNAPPRTPALSGRQLELAWNVLVARCAAAAASSPSLRSDRRRPRPQTGGTEERQSLKLLPVIVTPGFATWCNPRPTRLDPPALAPARIKGDIRSSTPRQRAGEQHAGNFSIVDSHLSFAPLFILFAATQSIVYIRICVCVCIYTYTFLYSDVVYSRERRFVPNSSRVFASINQSAIGIER